MIIHLSPDVPWLLRAAAASALTLHVGGGIVGVVSGGAALVFRKGDRLHRAAGDVFVVAMLISMTIAAITAPFVPATFNVPGAVFTAYLVATAWMTVRRRPGEFGRFEVAALFVIAAAAVAMGWFGWVGAHSPKGQIDGVPFQADVVVCAIAALAAALDLQMILRGGLYGAARVTRHLWRMCTALLFGAASFFIGQPQVFPPPLRGSPILVLPVLAIAAAMVFWLIRVRFAGAFRPTSARLPA